MDNVELGLENETFRKVSKDGYDFSFLYEEESDKLIKEIVTDETSSMEKVMDLLHGEEELIDRTCKPGINHYSNSEVSQDIEKPLTKEDKKRQTQEKLLELQESVIVQRREDLAKPIETLKIGNKSDIMNLMNIMTGGYEPEESNLEELQEERARIRFLREERERRAKLIELQEKQRQEILEKRRKEAEEAERLRLLEEKRRKEAEEAERLSRMKAQERARERARLEAEKKAKAEKERKRQELEKLRKDATTPKPRPRIKDKEVGTIETEWRPAKTKEGKFESDETQTYSLEKIEKDPSVLENTII